MMAVGDVYDAIRSERPYKKGMSHDKAFAILRESRGSHFDPQIVDIFLACDHQVQQIGEQWNDQLPAPWPLATSHGGDNETDC